MAVSQEIRDAETSARIALLKQITKAAPAAGATQILQLAQAYNAVAAIDAPREKVQAEAGGFA